MTIEKLHNGSYRISDIINDYLVEQVYYYYTKREAVKEFKQYTTELNNETITNQYEKEWENWLK